MGVPVKKPARISIVALGIASLSGCAVQGPAYEHTEVAPSKAAIYVYRTYPTLAYGAAVQVPINCSDNSINLGPGGYHVFNVESGDVLCSSHLENTASVNIKAEAGHDYYIKWWPSMGFFLPRVNAQQVEPDAAQSELQQCKRE